MAKRRKTHRRRNPYTVYGKKVGRHRMSKLARTKTRKRALAAARYWKIWGSSQRSSADEAKWKYIVRKDRKKSRRRNPCRSHRKGRR